MSSKSLFDIKTQANELLKKQKKMSTSNKSSLISITMSWTDDDQILSNFLQIITSVDDQNWKLGKTCFSSYFHDNKIFESRVVFTKF